MASTELRRVMRCPVCFGRDVDVTLLTSGDEYYCVHCSYLGTAEDVAGMYADLRKKYRWIQRRVSQDELRRL